MITSSERAVREVFYDLPWQSRDVAKEWLAVGYDLRDALLNSNALGKDEPRTPHDARREELQKTIDAKPRNMNPPTR
jgi:hypothetical protein